MLDCKNGKVKDYFREKYTVSFTPKSKKGKLVPALATYYIDKYYIFFLGIP